MCGVFGRNKWLHALCRRIPQQARVLPPVICPLRHRPVSTPLQRPSLPLARVLLRPRVIRRSCLQVHSHRAPTGISRLTLLLNTTTLSSSSLDGLRQVFILLHLRSTTRRVGLLLARRLQHLRTARRRDVRKIGDMNVNHRRVKGRERVRPCFSDSSSLHLHYLFVRRIQSMTSMLHALTRPR